MSSNPVDPTGGAEPAGSADPTDPGRATGRARPYVPGFGRVDWPEERIDAYARRVRLYHQPTARQVVRTSRPPFLRRVRAICGGCAATWPCREHSWSRDRLAPRRPGREAPGTPGWRPGWWRWVVRLVRPSRGPRV